MKPLTDRPTPETDALVNDPSQVFGIVKPGFSEWRDHARFLEQRLALAREALERVSCWARYADAPKPWSMETAASLEANLAECGKVAKQTLTATAPKQ